jgi:hypothetical protein
VGCSPDKLSKMMSGARRIDADNGLKLTRQLRVPPPEHLLGPAAATALQAIWDLEADDMPEATVQRIADTFAQGVSTTRAGLKAVAGAAGPGPKNTDR